MKKLFSALLAAALLFVFTSCGASGVSNTAADYSNSTQTGEVTAMDGTKVTLQLGELTENEVPEAPAGDTGAAAPAQGSDSSTSSQSETQTPAESTGETAPQAPSGTPPSGEAPGGTPPEGAAPGGSTKFTAGDTTATFDFADATITSEVDSTASAVADIAVGDVLVLTIGQNNAVTAVTIKNLNSAANTAGSGFGGSGEVTQGTAATTIREDGSYTGENIHLNGRRRKRTAHRRRHSDTGWRYCR